MPVLPSVFQAPYSYDNTQRTSLLLRLAWVQQRLCRGAVFARMRALLCPPATPVDSDAAQAQHQQQVAAWEQLSAAAAGASRDLGQVLTPEQWYYQQQQVQGMAGPRGKVLQVGAFGSHCDGLVCLLCVLSQWQLQIRLVVCTRLLEGTAAGTVGYPTACLLWGSRTATCLLCGLAVRF
jgi:hypothetical protein